MLNPPGKTVANQFKSSFIPSIMGKSRTSFNQNEDFFPKDLDIIVLSHLRWDFVFQRPQHLFTRFANEHRVFFVEEAHFDTDYPYMEVTTRQKGLTLLIPHLEKGLSEKEVNEQLKDLVDDALQKNHIFDFALWYYTPMALPFTRHLKAQTVVYDCMDELSLFKNAHPALLDYEAELFSVANVVFTGGQSLYEYKKNLHANIHPFPSSIDFDHFSKARSQKISAPTDQKNIAGPKIGFFGVIDERMDLEIIETVARARPNWNLVLLGPVVKIDPETLPRHPNIHYLGSKSYSELPYYLAGWDVAILPFARNPSTRFISPTKTPEYLAAGKPVVSTSIRDVVCPYSHEKLVEIADTPEQFTKAIEELLSRDKAQHLKWLKNVDKFLSSKSWDKTWAEMSALMHRSVQEIVEIDETQPLSSPQVRLGSVGLEF